MEFKQSQFADSQSDADIDRFIIEHINDDVKAMRLRYHTRKDLLSAIEQIELRQKARDKFHDSEGKSWVPRRLFSALSVEQATSHRIAAFHARIAGDARQIIDMTMGMGSDAFALSSIPNSEVIAIERNRELAEMSRINYAEIKNLTIINADSVEWLKATDCKVDLIFIDPARRNSAGGRVINLHDCTPDVLEILPLLFARSHRVIIKASPMLDITDTIFRLVGVRRVYAVEERGDCRELLFDMTDSFDGQPMLGAVRDSGEIFKFTREEEDNAVATYLPPNKGQYLYEPYPCVMKLGPFKLLSSKFQLCKAAANSHVYYGDEPVDAFPGKRYRIIDVMPYSSSIIKRFSRTYPNASVAVRNFPITADNLRQRLKVRESDTVRVIATTLQDASKVLIVTERL